MLHSISEKEIQMKISFFVSQVASAPGFANVVSGHVQIPLHTMKLLRDAGHTVELITTEFGKNQALPNCHPEGVVVHQVVNGSRQGQDLPMYAGYRFGIQPIKLIKQLSQIKKIVEAEQYDILHFSGSNKTAYLAGVIKLIGIKTPLVLTVNGYLQKRFWFATKYLWKQFSAIITSTEFYQNECETQGIPTVLIKHGIVRHIREELEEITVDKPQRVLFWRDPSIENGADICLQVYDRLAPLFPDVSFDLAIRPHPNRVPGIKELSDKYPNVNLYQCPYKPDISLAKLLSESICVLLPFRKLSTHPQLAVLESMLAHAVVVTTALDSNIELINSGRNGYLVPVGDVEATTEVVKELLNDRNKAAQVGKQAYEDMQTEWNWDTYVPKLVEIYTRAIGQ